MTNVQLIGLAILAFCAGYIVADLIRLSERPEADTRRENRLGLNRGKHQRALAESKIGRGRERGYGSSFRPIAVTDSEGVGPNEGESVRPRLMFTRSKPW